MFCYAKKYRERKGVTQKYYSLRKIFKKFSKHFGDIYNVKVTSFAALSDQLGGAVPVVIILAHCPQHLQAPGRLAPLLHHGAHLHHTHT